MDMSVHHHDSLWSTLYTGLLIDNVYDGFRRESYYIQGYWQNQNRQMLLSADSYGRVGAPPWYHAAYFTHSIVHEDTFQLILLRTTWKQIVPVGTDLEVS